MKALITIVLLSFPLLGVIAQNAGQKSNSSSELNYDMAPGAKLPAKFKVTDYSYKLEGIENVSPAKTEFNFYDNFAEDEVRDMKDSSTEQYEYFQRLKNYYDGLSNRVKTVFTFDEIWQVFSFDPELKNKLKTIK